MAAVTTEQVRAARDAGIAAGRALQPAAPNPYALHVPAWEAPRDPSALAALRERQGHARVLAIAWRGGYQDGQAAYARERGSRVG